MGSTMKKYKELTIGIIIGIITLLIYELIIRLYGLSVFFIWGFFVLVILFNYLVKKIKKSLV